MGEMFYNNGKDVATVAHVSRGWSDAPDAAGCCAACMECGRGRNLINGRWCAELRRYVEHCAEPPCGGEGGEP